MRCVSSPHTPDTEIHTAAPRPQRHATDAHVVRSDRRQTWCSGNRDEGGGPQNPQDRLTFVVFRDSSHTCVLLTLVQVGVEVRLLAKRGSVAVFVHRCGHSGADQGQDGGGRGNRGRHFQEPPKETWQWKKEKNKNMSRMSISQSSFNYTIIRLI